MQKLSKTSGLIGGALVAAALLLTGWLAFRNTGEQCTPAHRLPKHAGHYARQSLWRNLPEAQVWSLANQKHGGQISAVEIGEKGEIASSYSWHEGGGHTCVAFRKDALWVKDDNLPTAWHGPFVRVADPAPTPNRTKHWEEIYFARLFGDTCYRSNGGGDWCFGNSSIKMGAKHIKARLALDMMEMPIYGSPVLTDEDRKFWVFVPTATGWNVFRDGYITEEGYKQVDPNTAPPWRVLTRK